MTDLPLDPFTEERLLRGHLTAADAPPGWAGVADVLACAAAPGQVHGPSGEAVVAAVLDAMASAPSPTGRPRRMISKLRSAKVAVASAAVLIAAGGAAAAAGATGNLPSFGEATVHLASSGSSAPSSSDGPTTNAKSPTRRGLSAGSGRSAAAADGRDPAGTQPGTQASVPGAAPGVLSNGEGITGLCTAFLARYDAGERDFSHGDGAFAELVKAHDDAAGTETFCAGELRAAGQAVPSETGGGSTTGGGGAATSGDQGAGAAEQHPSTTGQHTSTTVRRDPIVPAQQPTPAATDHRSGVLAGVPSSSTPSGYDGASAPASGAGGHH
ncbi:MAG TPA: hypothetical protein VFP61_10700 [Acidimicrobiales bacterium]|nr:hypothetical protein [Acidimicrobiales bacterium]